MSKIRVIGANQNNLKNVSVDIPKHQLTVFTGRSGSGKSSLVFSTLAAESERLLNETYSSYIQHQLTQYEKPDVDHIENLPVAMIINQKRLDGNSRSTVGTISDIYASAGCYGHVSVSRSPAIPMYFHSIPPAACVKDARVSATLKILI